jgi:hypothetical protein
MINLLIINLGPGGQNMYNAQMNGGDDAIVPASLQQQQQTQQQRQHQQQQQLAHLLQQGQKNNPIMVNPHLKQLGNNSALGQGGPNANAMNNLGVSMPMSMATNNNGTNAMSMQGT